MADDSLISLAAKLGEALKQHRLVLALAESCTGGMAAQTITAIAGSSNWFDRGFVTYSNAAKHEMLGVSLQTLETHGAVSEQTACEMALGALKYSHANISAAITGIAGPDGGTPDKPVGTVCFAWGQKNGPIKSATVHFSGNRREIRQSSVKSMLEGLLELTLNSDL